MNFFDEQARAQRNTTRLVVLFSLAVISLIAVTVVAVVGVLAALDSTGQEGVTLANRLQFAWSMLDWQLAGSVAAIVLTVVLLGSLYKQFQLRGGGRAVAESLGGRLIPLDTQAADERQILNVVQEIAIAAGIAAPPVYVIEDDAINAFAAGQKPEDAVIGITRGCIGLLNREELQGVIAHEFSHIFHGDMRLNLRLVAALHGILMIGLVGYTLLRAAPFRRSSNKSNAGAIMLGIGIALIIIGFAGTFFGNLIKAGVSRQREFLADASAVQYTRNPNGIAGALKKIGAYSAGSQVQAVHAPEFSHMFFSQAVGNSLSGLLATHPPLAQRIRRVQPDWDGKLPPLTRG